MKTLFSYFFIVEESIKNFFKEADRQMLDCDEKKTEIIVDAMYKLYNASTPIHEEIDKRFKALKILNIIGKDLSDNAKRYQKIPQIAKLLSSGFSEGYSRFSTNYCANENKLAISILKLYQYGYKNYRYKISAKEFVENPSNLAKVIHIILYKDAEILSQPFFAY